MLLLDILESDLPFEGIPLTACRVGMGPAWRQEHELLIEMFRTTTYASCHPWLLAYKSLYGAGADARTAATALELYNQHNGSIEAEWEVTYSSRAHYGGFGEIDLTFLRRVLPTGMLGSLAKLELLCTGLSGAKSAGQETTTAGWLFS